MTLTQISMNEIINFWRCRSSFHDVASHMPQNVSFEALFYATNNSCHIKKKQDRNVQTDVNDALWSVCIGLLSINIVIFKRG